MSDQLTIGVLGAGGFIGRHAVRRFTTDGAGVVPLVRRGGAAFPGARAAVVRAYDRVNDFEEALEGLDVLVHAAASNTVSKSACDPMREVDTDLRSVGALVDALQRRSGTHVVFLSSGGTVYGDGSPGARIGEGARRSPKSFHGASKVAAEHFLLAWAAQHAGALTIIRPSNLYGPGQAKRAGFGVIPALMDSARSGEPFLLRGSRHMVRDYLFIDDFVDLLARIVHGKAPERPLILNASSGYGEELGSLIARVERITERKIPVRAGDAISSDVSSIVLDSARAKACFGWEATTPLSQGIERTWEWFVSRETTVSGAGSRPD